jgi:hypothetical protein
MKQRSAERHEGQKEEGEGEKRGAGRLSAERVETIKAEDENGVRTVIGSWMDMRRL